ncbi:MAG: hypothetical protein ABI968_01705 [Acidobacteriota bacterium]
MVLLAVLLALSSCASAPHPPAAARDRFPLDPREGLAGPFEESIELGWRALTAAQPERAGREFDRTAHGPSRRAAAIGRIEALVLADLPADAVPLCGEALSDGEPTLPLLTACGEAYAGAGELPAAFPLYERATARSPGRRGVAQRSEQLRGAATDALLSAAQRDALEGRREVARVKVAQALAWNPDTAEVLARAAEVECAAGEKERALGHYRDALAMGGVDQATEERAGDLALETGDYSMAVVVFEGLSARDPRLRERAAEARLAFRIDNWPDAERQAARARRLTRAGAAQLTWWMFPEVREARVRSGIVATDVLERRDSRVMMRAIALGLLDVDRETHRVRPDANLSRGGAAQLMLRVAVFLGKTDHAGDCLSHAGLAAYTGPDAIRLATRCGLLSESGGTFVGGPEMTRGLDRLRSAIEEAASRD